MNINNFIYITLSGIRIYGGDFFECCTLLYPTNKISCSIFYSFFILPCLLRKLVVMALHDSMVFVALNIFRFLLTALNTDPPSIYSNFQCLAYRQSVLWIFNIPSRLPHNIPYVFICFFWLLSRCAIIVFIFRNSFVVPHYVNLSILL